MNVYIYKFFAIPDEKVDAVEKMLGIALSQPAFIKTGVFQAKHSYLPLPNGEYTLDELVNATESLEDTMEKESLLKKLSKLPIKEDNGDEWLVVENDGYEV